MGHYLSFALLLQTSSPNPIDLADNWIPILTNR